MPSEPAPGKPGAASPVRSETGAPAKSDAAPLRRLTGREADELLAVVLRLHERLDQFDRRLAECERARPAPSPRPLTLRQELAAEPLRVAAALRRMALVHPEPETADALNEAADLFEAVIDRILWLEASNLTLLDAAGFPIGTAPEEVPS